MTAKSFIVAPDSSGEWETALSSTFFY